MNSNTMINSSSAKLDQLPAESSQGLPKVVSGSTAATGSLEKVYRLALYGRRNAGKTCILTALAMPRYAHPRGYSCTWIDNPINSKRSRSKEAPPADDPALPYRRGSEWLEEAKQQLKSGKVPEANRIAAPDEMRLVYEFTSPDQGCYRVELLDYSGELIDPKCSDDDLAVKLREHMVAMDGILVLAEAPHRGEPLGELYQELEKLRRAFAKLRDQKRERPLPETPIALLINKWDRYSQVARWNSDTKRICYNPEELDREVQDFLQGNPEPPHRSLADMLAGPEDHDNFKTFALSAFGPKAEDEQVPQDRPAQVDPLRSYGLEDPFVWICQRCRTIQLRQLEEVSNRLDWWHFWQFGTSKAKHQANNLGRVLQERFPKGSEERQRVDRHLKRIARVSFGQRSLAIGMLLLVILVLALGGEYLWDDDSYKWVQATLNNPEETDPTKIEAAKRWLEDYATSSLHWLYRLRYTQQQAREELAQRRQFEEDNAWKEVEKLSSDPLAQLHAARKLRNAYPNSNRKEELDALIDKIEADRAKKQREELYAQIRETKDEVFKEQLALKYLRDFPEGEHRVECEAIIQKAEANRRTQANEQQLVDLENELKSLVSKQVEEVIPYDQLEKRVKEWPVNRGAATQEQRDRHILLQNNIAKRRDEIHRLVRDRQIAENRAHLKAITEQLNATTDEDDLRLIQSKLKAGLPFPNNVPDDLRAELLALKQKTESKLNEEIKRKEWLAFQEKYNNCMCEGKLSDAAALLVGRKPDTKELQDLKADFSRRCVPYLSDKVNEFLGGENWDTARDVVRKAKEDLHIAELLPKVEKDKLADLNSHIDKRHDKSLYDKAKQTKSRQDLQAYVDQAPLKTMLKHAKDRISWLDKMDGSLELEVEGSVTWGDNCWSRYNNDVRITVNDKELVKVNAFSTAGKEVGLGTMPVTYKLNDTVRVQVDIQAKWTGWSGPFFIYSASQGQGKVEAKVKEFRGNGKMIELDKFGNKVLIKIKESSLPKEPVLPDWRED
jgi:hypothetical protein